MARSSQRNSILIVAFLAICGFLGMLFAEKNPVNAHDSDSDVSDSLKQFANVYDIVEQNYAEPVKPR
jgi:carboxyl-terminal processing protease